MSDDAFGIADTFCAALEARSEERLAAIYDDDIVVWNNVTQKAMSKAENVAILGQVFRVSRDIKYVDRRRHAFDGGFVQMHTLTGTFTDGTALPPLAACIVVETRNGRITRIDEYFDLAIYGPVFERIAALEEA